MSKIFENIGKELDSMLKEGEAFIKELDETLSETIKAETSKEKVKERKDQFETFVNDIDKEFTSFIDSLQKDMKISKIKIFKIRMKNFEKAEIKYKKKSNKISIGKEGSEKSFDINLVDDISKKKVQKILESVTYNKETNIINITVKRKFLRKD